MNIKPRKCLPWLAAIGVSLGIASTAQADNAAVTVAVSGTTVTAGNASAANYDNYTWHKSAYTTLKLKVPASADFAEGTYVRLTSLSIGAQNGGQGNYNNQVKYLAVTGVDGFSYKSAVISTTASGFSSSAATPETSDKQTFALADPWCFLVVGTEYAVDLLDENGSSVAGLSARCVEYTDSVLSNWNGAQWTPLAELTAEIVTPTTPAAVEEAGDCAIVLDGLATYPSISVTGNLTVTGSGTIIVTGDFTLGGTLTVDSGVNFAFTTTTGKVTVPKGTAFAGVGVNASNFYITSVDTYDTDATLVSWTGGAGIPARQYSRLQTSASKNINVTQSGNSFIGGWQLYWSADSGSNWSSSANWKKADGSNADGYPSNGTSIYDHAYVNEATTINMDNARTTGKVTLNADTTITGGKQLGFNEINGSGKLTLSNGVLGTASMDGTIYNDLCISGENTFNPGSRKISIQGDLTGSGKITTGNGNNTSGGIWFYGDNSEFYGTFDNSSSTRMNETSFSSANASSSNAVWIIQARSASHRSSGVYSDGPNETSFLRDTGYYYFGALNGYLQTGDAGPMTIEVGARDDVESSVKYRGRGTTSKGLQRYANIVKVGSNIFTIENSDYGYDNNFGDVTIKGGILTLPGFPNYGTFIMFAGEGATLKTTPSSTIEGDVVTDTTPEIDFSSRIKYSTSSICFDTAATSPTWASPLDSSNTGGFTKKGAGTLTLTAIPQYSGATRVEEGTLVVPLGTSLGDVYVAEDATLTVDLTGATSSSAFLTCASMENNGTVNWINAPDGITPQTVKTDGKYFIAVPRTLTWSGAGDDTAWTTAGNWLVGEDAATLAPQSFDSVLFNTTTPGVTLSAAAEVASVTAPNGLTLATACDLTVYGDFTVTGAFVKSGKGTLTVEGTFGATGGTTVNNGAIDANLESAQTVAFNADSAFDNCVDMTSNGYGAKFVTPNANLLTVTGNGVVDASGAYAVTSGTFAGRLSGSMNLTKTGDGTFTLFGNQTFDGDVTVSGGTLKLGTPLDLADVRADFDASLENTIDLTGENATWHDATRLNTEAAYLVNDGTNPAFVENDENIFGGKKVLYSDGFKMVEPNISGFLNVQAMTSFFVMQNREGQSRKSNGYQHIATDNGNSTSWYIGYRNFGYMVYDYNTWYSPGMWANGNLGDVTTTASSGNNGGIDFGLNPAVLSAVAGHCWLRGSNNSRAYIGGAGKQAWAEYLTYTRALSFDEKAAVEQYLMAKWGINSATYAALPATADVTVAAGATLDLGGQTVTVASLNLSGTIQNGTLIVTGNNLTIANSTAAITATVKISGYDSSMTAPAGFSFTDNGDGTATVVPVYTWTDANGDHAWGTAGNWDKNAVPGENNEVVFPSENAPEGGWTVYVGQGTQTCLSMTLNADVTLSLNASQSDWSGINVKGSIEGSGKLILWRSGVNNFAANPVTISCPLVVKANGSDSFLQKVGFNVTGAVEVNSLFVVYDATEFSGAVTLNNGAVVRSSESWYKDGAEAQVTFSGAIAIPADATVSFDRSSQTITGSVTMGAGSTFTLSSATTATEATFTLGDGAKLVVPTGASVTAANITSAAGGDTIASYTSGTGTVYVNNTVATWKSTVSAGSWKDAANWENGVVPTSYTDVVFPAGTYTVYISDHNWEPWSERDKAKGVTVNGDVTLQKDGGGWNYLSLYGNIGGTGTLKLTWTGIENFSGSEMTIGCNVEVVNVAGHDSYLNQIAGNGYRFTGDVTLHGWFQCWENVVFAGTLTIDTASALTIGDDDTLTIADLVVTADTAAQITGGSSVTITGTVTLEGADSQLTIPANAVTTGATFTTPLTGYTVEVNGNVYSVAVDTNITPGGTSIGYDSEADATAAAAGYTVVLTSEQETQGLEANYYVTSVVYDEGSGKYVVTAVLNNGAESAIKPVVSSDAAVVANGSITLSADNLKPGLYYRLVASSDAAGETVTAMSDWTAQPYKAGDSVSLSLALPTTSDVLYYAFEASDTK